jgi:hypothetical protein
MPVARRDSTWQPIDPIDADDRSGDSIEIDRYIQFRLPRRTIPAKHTRYPGQSIVKLFAPFVVLDRNGALGTIDRDGIDRLEQQCAVEQARQKCLPVGFDETGDVKSNSARFGPDLNPRGFDGDGMDSLTGSHISILDGNQMCLRYFMGVRTWH